MDGRIRDTIQVPMGVSQAATIRVGYFFGAGDSEGIRRAGWTSLVMGTGFMLLTAAAMLLVPGTLLGLPIKARLAIRFTQVVRGTAPRRSFR